MYINCRDRDHLVVGFTTTCGISAYHHWICEFEPHSWWGVLDTTLCDKVCQWLDTTLCDKVCQWLDTTLCDKVCQWLDTTLCDKVCQWLATGRWFSPGTPGFFHQ